jgi:hypothetical protein
MSWPRRLVLLLAIVVPVAVVSTLLYRSRAHSVAEDEAAVAHAKRRLELLAAVQHRVSDYQRRKTDYEARIGVIAEVRARHSPLTLAALVAAADALGLATDGMAVSAMAVTLSFRAAPREPVERLGLELEKRRIAFGAGVRAGENGGYVLTATLFPAPRARPQGPHRP